MGQLSRAVPPIGDKTKANLARSFHCCLGKGAEVLGQSWCPWGQKLLLQMVCLGSGSPPIPQFFKSFQIHVYQYLRGHCSHAQHSESPSNWCPRTSPARYCRKCLLAPRIPASASLQLAVSYTPCVTRNQEFKMSFVSVHPCPQRFSTLYQRCLMLCHWQMLASC